MLVLLTLTATRHRKVSLHSILFLRVCSVCAVPVTKLGVGMGIGMGMQCRNLYPYPCVRVCMSWEPIDSY